MAKCFNHKQKSQCVSSKVLQKEWLGCQRQVNGFREEVARLVDECQKDQVSISGESTKWIVEHQNCLVEQNHSVC